jgi:hypothetical protein
VLIEHRANDPFVADFGLGVLGALAAIRRICDARGVP